MAVEVTAFEVNFCRTPSRARAVFRVAVPISSDFPRNESKYARAKVKTEELCRDECERR